jgi:hypothetical protein
MLQKTIPNPEITQLLAEIIRDSKLLWESLPSRNISKSTFLSKQIPIREEVYKEDIGRSLGITHENFSKIISILGSAQITNAMVYYPMSMMGWHTNSNNIGKRIYYTFSAKESLFRYLDPITNEYINSYDDIGWTTREFVISKERPLWHCVWTEDIRFSFGFNKSIDDEK